MSSALDGFATRRLWSLWEMLESFAQEFTRLGAFMGACHGRFNGPMPLEPESVAFLSLTLKQMQACCSKLSLPTGVGLLEWAQLHPPKTMSEMMVYMKAIDLEMAEQKFLFVPPDRVTYYENDRVLSEIASDAFPNTKNELRLAGNCFSTENYTASVFHSMRALETALGALCASVDVTVNKQTWHGLLDEIEAKVKQKREAKDYPDKAAEVQFEADACVEFRHFKDAWRNHVSHNRTSYDHSQAKRIVDHVAIFIETLSERLREPTTV